MRLDLILGGLAEDRATSCCRQLGTPAYLQLHPPMRRARDAPLALRLARNCVIRQPPAHRRAPDAVHVLIILIPFAQVVLRHLAVLHPPRKCADVLPTERLSRIVRPLGLHEDQRVAQTADEGGGLGYGWRCCGLTPEGLSSLLLLLGGARAWHAVDVKVWYYSPRARPRGGRNASRILRAARVWAWRVCAKKVG